ncbi:MAG: phosphate uptake regulator PhoU [Candidatus Korarchaeota archaeon]|nr:phosphate uptake regulator PhoU [Candidatus Korarchaeota archaeon]
MPPEKEIRKVQMLGRSSLSVTLPKSWARSIGLTKDDLVEIRILPDQSLKLIPLGRAREEFQEVVVRARPSDDLRSLIMRVISAYLAGRDLITVELGGTSAGAGELKSAARSKLVGVEVVAEKGGTLTFQCMRTYSDFPAPRAFNRMSSLAADMVTDATEALLSGDAELAEEIVARDEEVDKFYFLIGRQASAVVSGRLDPEDVGLRWAADALGYRLAAKAVERVGDHASNVAKSALKFKEPLSGLEDMRRLARMGADVLRLATDSLTSLDMIKAGEALSMARGASPLADRILEVIIVSDALRGKKVRLGLTLESLRRVAEYGSDVAEVTMDLLG